ncbi:hypothetical protein ACQPZA_24105 [Pseudonocardia xinjiangensis]|uniref:hypothetical protein n=1 Tax=Pseudonocardia xinjiangensis TaxID=75289 RepID=UPI003D90B966
MGFHRVFPAMLLLTAVVAGCSSPSVPPPAPTTPSTPADAAEQRALTAYEDFWTVTNSALAAPKSRDWTARLQEVATGQALESLRTDVENYASLPAHTEGAVTREPVVHRLADNRVEVVDCIDLGDSRLVSDTTGAVLDDLANRVQRYRYRAELLTVGDGWVVERTAPALDEPC